MKTYKSQIDKLSLVREKTDFPRAQIVSSTDGSKYARQFYFDDIAIYESFFMILLNNSNNTVGFVKISQGGITGTLVDVRLIAKYAIEGLATTVILVHNHPSGSLRPSLGDKQVTAKVTKALKLFDIKVLDHLILTEEAYFSFQDEGILDD